MAACMSEALDLARPSRMAERESVQVLCRAVQQGAITIPYSGIRRLDGVKLCLWIPLHFN